MATFSKRKDSRGNITYQVKIRKKGMPTLSKTFPLKSQAQAWANEQENTIRMRGVKDRSKAKGVTLDDLIDRYLKEVTPEKESSDVEEVRLQAMRRGWLAKMLVLDITGEHIRKYADERLEIVKPSTVNRDLNTLSHVFSTASKEWGYPLADNPVQDIRRPKNPPARERLLTDAEEARLLEACGETRAGYLGLVVQLALETAMRLSELVGMQWQYVDFDRRTIRLVKTKNGEQRGVPMSKKTIELLRSIEPEWKLDAAGQEIKVGEVFPGLTSRAVKISFIRTCQRAKIKDLHFHDLRHTAITRLFTRKHLGMMEVASISGHKDLRMLKRYTHLDTQSLAMKLG